LDAKFFGKSRNFRQKTIPIDRAGLEFSDDVYKLAPLFGLRMSGSIIGIRS